MSGTSILARLKTPYPQPLDPRGALRKALMAGVIVSLIDYFFEPFGLSTFTHPHKGWVLIGFGVPVFFWVFVIGFLVPYYSPYFERLKPWTVGKQMLTICLITTGITVTMYFYARWVGFRPFTDVRYLIGCCMSFAVAITIFFLFFDRSNYLAAEEGRQRQESEELRMLMRESHHRMRNHLQVIASILRLQAHVVTDARALDALRTSEHRLESIAILHEKLYRHDDGPSHVMLREYLEELTRIIAQHHAELVPNVAIQVEDRVALRVPLDTAVPLGLIVNELVTNSFKHAFQALDAGRIQLELDRTPDGQHLLTVRDNGPGVPAELMNQHGLSPGALSGSLGLRLIGALTQQLRGQLAYRHNGGAEFAVRF